MSSSKGLLIIVSFVLLLLFSGVADADIALGWGNISNATNPDYNATFFFDTPANKVTYNDNNSVIITNGTVNTTVAVGSGATITGYSTEYGNFSINMVDNCTPGQNCDTFRMLITSIAYDTGINNLKNGNLCVQASRDDCKPSPNTDKNFEITNMAYVYNLDPNGNYGSIDNVYIYKDNFTGNPDIIYDAYLELPVVSSFISLNLLIYNSVIGNIGIYTTTYFNESNLTWNNKPIKGNLIGNFSAGSLGYWITVNLTNPSQYIVISVIGNVTEDYKEAQIFSDDSGGFNPYVSSINYDPSGYVNDSGGTPIHNAFLNYTNATATRTAYSNATGYYQLMNISDGSYSYSITRTGKVTQTGTIQIANGGQLKNYTLTDSGTTTCTENSICQLDTNASFNLSNTSYLYGQNFNLTPTVGWDAIVEFQALNLNVSKTGSPGAITVDVYVTDTSTGFPFEAQTCTGTLLAADVSTNFTWEMVPFGSGCTGNGSFPYILSPNSRQLVFVVSAVGVDGSNYYTFRNSTGNNFTDGTMIVNSGSGWQNVPDRDFAFELFYLQDHRPGAPTNIAPANASVNQSLSLTFSWTAAVDQDGDQIRYSLILNGGASSYNCNLQLGLTCDVTGLTPSTNYTWQISPADPWLLGTTSANWTFRTRAPLLNLYAKWNGSDTNNGESWALAFRNISYGINYSITYGVNNANTVLNIAPGNYSGDPTLTRRWLGRLKCNTSGTAQNASQIWCSYPRWNMTQS